MRYAPRRRSGSAELLYLFLVLAAGLSTAWWASQMIGFDLSPMTAMAAALGIRKDAHVAREPVGYVASDHRADAPATKTQAPQAPYCAAGAAPAFSARTAALAQHTGTVIGTPLECEHPASTSGDTVQTTSTGLVAYRRLTQVVSFTDGWRHYALGSDGYVTWEGTDGDPPPSSALQEQDGQQQ